MGRFSRSMGWLYSGLNLVDPTVPSVVADDVVVPVLDVTQQGWALGTWTPQTDTVGASQPAQSLYLPGGSNEDTRMIVGHSIQRTGGASTPTLNWYLTYAQTSNRVGWLQSWANFAVGASLSWASISGSMTNRLLLPPGFLLELVLPATGAGESWTVFTTYLRVPSGFKLL